jgi:hypothetical protein
VQVDGFAMPIKVALYSGRFGWIHPTERWQELQLSGMKGADFSVDTDDFYVLVHKQ